MIAPLSEQLNFAPDALEVPPAFAEEILSVSRQDLEPEVAREVVAKLKPVLKTHRPDQKLALAWGLLVEKQRESHGMRAFWEDIQHMFPSDDTALRMLMRWYRREGKVAEGIQYLSRLFPETRLSLKEAEKALIGLSELKAWEEIDAIMGPILHTFPNARPIRMRYIKILDQQARFIDAKAVADTVRERHKMGDCSQTLLESVEQRARTLQLLRRDDSSSAIADVVYTCPLPRPMSPQRRAVFFNGQLGTGGAERQMSRIACALHTGKQSDPQVWVKHANPATGADFYLSTLLETGVTTRILSEEADVGIEDIEGLSVGMLELLDLLPADLQKSTAQLVPMFREHETDIAYIWQDGGVAAAAVAALLAGVPRIVTSFRGLPPNLRRHLWRPELEPLFKALAQLPHVSFSANSQAAATAYEDWLELTKGTIAVVPNATPPVLGTSKHVDVERWNEITSRSDNCTKTVLGVFRFDKNKRPTDWIRAAGAYLEKQDDTRFIIVGDGVLRGEMTDLIAELGLEDRVFLPGLSDCVGFWMIQADLVLHLAQMEGLPNVLIEAQLAGKAVLATPAGGTAEVVADGKTGILLSQSNVLPVEELNQTLHMLLSSPDALEAMGAAAIAHAGDRFSVDSVLKRTQRLFEYMEMDN